MPDIVILIPMKEEIKLCASVLQQAKVVRTDNLKGYSGKMNGKEVVLIESGIGGARTSEKVKPAADYFSANKLYHFGTCGGFNPKLRIGQIVEPFSLQCLYGQENSLGESDKITFSNPEILINNYNKQETESLKVSRDFFRVKGLCLDKEISDSGIAKIFYERYGFDIVDYESYAFAERCIKSGISFGIFRMVSDYADTTAITDFDVNCNNHIPDAFRKIIGKISIS